MDFSDFRVNAASFAEERQQARPSDDIMYRDTDQGLRHLVKQGDERVVSDTVNDQRARRWRSGTIVDPSYDYPLPLVGIDYVNFNFLNRGLQLGFIFSGVLAAGNLQKAKIGGSKFDVSVDFYGIAVKSNDQVYDEERRADGRAAADPERVDRREPGLPGHRLPEDHAELARPVRPLLSPTPDYTDPDFVVPADTVDGERRLQLRVPPRRLLAARQLGVPLAGRLAAVGQRRTTSIPTRAATRSTTSASRRTSTSR